MALNQTAGYRITSVSGGIITAYTILLGGGTGYYVQNDVNMYVGVGSGSAWSIDILTVDGAGAITSSVVRDGGSGHAVNDTGLVNQFVVGAGSSSGYGNKIA